MLRKGFTLAEVLITLGIIGILAALTMPSLIMKANTAKIGPEMANAVSVLSNAIDMYMQDNNASSLVLAMRKSGVSDTSMQNLLSTLLGEYIKGTSGVTVPSTPVTTYNGASGEGAQTLKPTVTTGIALSNKSLLVAETDCKFGTTKDASGNDITIDSCGVIFYTSGYAKKDQLVTARDMFKFTVTNKGEVIPYAADWNSKDCKSSGVGNGTTCAGRIAEKGWVVDY